MKAALIVSLLILGAGLAGLFVVVYQKNTSLEKELAVHNQLLGQLPTSLEVPVFIGPAKQKQAVATMSATAVLIADRKTGTFIYQRGAQQQRYPASTAKLMTALVARKIYQMDQVLTVQEETFTEGTVMGVLIGEKLTVRDLLAGLLISSGNDAAFVLANNAPGGYARFIELMNEEAAQLGLEDTYFVNASGLDDDQQQSSARDLLLLTDAVLADPFLADLVQTKEVTITDVSGTLSHPLINRNLLLHSRPGVFGVKTGTTDLAGENLITAIREEGRETIIVLLGSKARYYETQFILDWMAEHYEWQNKKITL